MNSQVTRCQWPCANSVIATVIGLRTVATFSPPGWTSGTHSADYAHADGHHRVVAARTGILSRRATCKKQIGRDRDLLLEIRSSRRLQRSFLDGKYSENETFRLRQPGVSAESSAASMSTGRHIDPRCIATSSPNESGQRTPTITPRRERGDSQEGRMRHIGSLRPMQLVCRTRCRCVV